MKKFLYAALIVFALGFISCGATFADDALANSMAPGTWTTNSRYITFGEYNGHALKWRVLEVRGDKTAFLVLDDVLQEVGGDVKEMFFDDDKNDGEYTDSFPDSAIKAWLNGEFLDDTFATNEQDAILETNYGPDNARLADQYTWTEGKSKVFLLSVGETMNPKYFNINFEDGFYGYYDNGDRTVGIVDDISGYYWLRSPAPDFFGNSAAVVQSGGSIFLDGLRVDSSRAVRPALKINLASPVFTSALVSYPPEGE